MATYVVGMNNFRSTESPLLDAKSLAPRLGLNHKAVLHFARNGVIPSVRIGRLVRFDPSQIERWISEGGLRSPESDSSQYEVEL